MRVLLSILAVTLFILGTTLNRPILIVIAGVLLLIVLGSLAWMWHRRQSEQRRRDRSSAEDDEGGDELSDLGIMDISPKEIGQGDETHAEEEAPLDPPQDAPDLPPEPADAEREAAPPPPAEAPPDETDQTDLEGKTARDLLSRDESAEQQSESDVTMTSPEPEKDDAPAETEKSEEALDSDEADEEQRAAAPSPQPSDAPDERDTLTPLLRSLQAAVDAHTAALLKQEDIALNYEVAALVSDHPAGALRAGDDFMTSTPLLTAGMTQRDVTVQRVGEMALPRESLGYYDDDGDSGGVRQVMIAPVKRSSEPASYFLLTDTTREGGFNADPPRALIARYANLVTTLLARSETPPDDESAPDARPRREIIDEEMEAARADDRPLALALVYLNRAEALGDEGEHAVSAAERTLRQRLEEAASEGRVERFGELTYGVFYPANGTEVEDWAMQLQSDLDQERGRLEGGVSIGVAVLSDRHDAPDALRADATEALREAYTTGTCTILE